MTFTPQSVQRPRQQVESQIRNAIVTKQLSEGDRLPSETDLAKQFGVARSTVREALRSLASAGLIDKVPGATGGSFVRRMDAEMLGRSVSEGLQLLMDLGNATPAEVTTVRGLLEVPSCRLAAENRTDEDLERLSAMLEEQKTTPVADPVAPNLDIQFHWGVALASQNRVLSALVYALHSGTRPADRVQLSPDDGRNTVGHHLQLFRAIERQDPDGAEEAIRTHLDYLGTLREGPPRSKGAKAG